MRALLLAVVVALASSAASAQSWNSHPGGATFTGGTLTSPLVLSSVANACNGTLPMSFASDSNTGVVHISADTWAVCNNGFETMRFSSGNVTIVGGSGAIVDSSDRAAFDLINGNKYVSLLQADNADAIIRLCNTDSTSCGEVGYGHSSGSGVGSDFFDMWVVNKRGSSNGGLHLGVLANTTAINVNHTGGVTIAGVPQTAACAAGVLALDPVSDVVEIDANGAACVVTLGEANATVGRTVTMIITTSAGGGLVTFPDVSNKHLGPTLCTSTGIPLGGVYTVYYAGTVLEYLGESCVVNQ